jgi:hypothetical protein
LEDQVLGDVLFVPIVLGEVVLEDELGIVGVAEEVALADWLYFVIEELECVLVGELDNIVLEGSNTLKELTRV